MKTCIKDAHLQNTGFPISYSLLISETGTLHFESVEIIKSTGRAENYFLLPVNINCTVSIMKVSKKCYEKFLTSCSFPVLRAVSAHNSDICEYSIAITKEKNKLKFGVSMLIINLISVCIFLMDNLQHTEHKITPTWKKNQKHIFIMRPV